MASPATGQRGDPAPSTCSPAWASSPGDIAYIVIGAIAVMLAFGFARHEPDRAGAIEAIAGKPFGYLLL
jgi:Domain of Unknown Function (DUF1206)